MKDKQRNEDAFLYESAEREFDVAPIPELAIKALALADGDEAKQKWVYVKLRVSQLAQEAKCDRMRQIPQLVLRWIRKLLRRKIFLVPYLLLGVASAAYFVVGVLEVVSIFLPHEAAIHWSGDDDFDPEFVWLGILAGLLVYLLARLRDWVVNQRE